jgi:ubiquinone/menaquinone biosynthesis C-methylase UbiE
MLSEKYNNIGKTYNQTRKADQRILKNIIEELGLDSSAKILDVGAGTGNYSFELAAIGYEVYALEPSEIMISQGKRHEKLKWHEGIAEDIPFGEGTFDGVTCILSTHHFTNLELSLNEIKRVLKEHGVAVIFTADPRLCPTGLWLNDYFNDIIKKSHQIHPPAQDLKRMVENIFGNDVKMTTFLIPYDLQDGFFFSAWRYPERYLETTFCNGISSFAETPKEILNKYQEKLKRDIENGNLRNKYGHVLNKNEYDCGYFFLNARKSSPSLARIM